MYNSKHINQETNFEVQINASPTVSRFTHINSSQVNYNINYNYLKCKLRKNYYIYILPLKCLFYYLSK